MKNDKSLKKIGPLPKRSEVAPESTWNLRRVFKSDAEWERTYAEWSKMIDRFSAFRGKLGDVKALADFFTFETEFDRRSERLALYAYLKSVEELTDTVRQERKDRLFSAFSRVGETFSFVQPELLALPQSVWKKLLADRRLSLWRRKLEELLRFKPHTLSAKEERLLAMSAEMGQTASKAFRMLTDADMTFDEMKDADGVKRPLTQESFTLFLHAPKRSVRREAFRRFYHQFDAHKNTLATALDGSIRKDVFYARARNYSSAQEAALFAENIPSSVYDQLIDSVHAALPSLYRYYELRRKAMKLGEIHFYDTYVPILSDITTRYTWDEAVEQVLDALSPLGPEYVATLRRGLTKDRWADRCENVGKQSGAFSYPSCDYSPFLMLNYKPEIIESVFTLAHEAGHSMHSYLSARKQPYESYNYEIFLAEIASTFNEQLLTEHLIKTAKDERFRAWLINRQSDGIRATLFRQTMFSEFERDAHRAAEEGQPLTVDTFRTLYRSLLNQYFGPKFVIDDELELECLRIPHFYRAFYVYKYATGLSAAVALSRRVLNGGERERLDYFQMLEGGSSAPPLELLRRAGVDMEKPDAIQAATAHFDTLVSALADTLS